MLGPLAPHDRAFGVGRGTFVMNSGVMVPNRGILIILRHGRPGTHKKRHHRDGRQKRFHNPISRREALVEPSPIRQQRIRGRGCSKWAIQIRVGRDQGTNLLQSLQDIDSNPSHTLRAVANILFIHLRPYG
jgi:hypothetical protein